jgi:hypothetical protein
MERWWGPSLARQSLSFAMIFEKKKPTMLFFTDILCTSYFCENVKMFQVLKHAQLQHSKMV